MIKRGNSIASLALAAAIAIYILVCAILSVAATAFMPDYTGKDISKVGETHA